MIPDNPLISLETLASGTYLSEGKRWGISTCRPNTWNCAARVYYARISTPTELRHLGLPKHWRENLRTRDLGAALQARRTAVARLRDKLAAAARAAQPSLADQISAAVKGVGARIMELGTSLHHPSPSAMAGLQVLQSETTALVLAGLPGVQSPEQHAPIRVEPAAPEIPTFAEAATSYGRDHGAKWRRDEWTPSLRRHAFPKLGDRRVNTIGTEDVLSVIRSLWATHTETGDKVRQRVESILDYSKTRGWRDCDNPAKWRGHLANVLPNKRKIVKTKHHKHADWKEAPAIWQAICVRVSAAPDPINLAGCRALRFSILTCCRREEALGMPWSEINWQRGTWDRPAARVKESEDHSVGLSGAALELLRRIKDDTNPKPDSLVFAGRGRRGNLKADTMRQKLQSIPGCEKLTQHGWRSTFKTWAQEQTTYARELSEAALSVARLQCWPVSRRPIGWKTMRRATKSTRRKSPRLIGKPTVGSRRLTRTRKL